MMMVPRRNVSSKHGGKIWNLLPYRDERGRNRKKAHARQEIFPERRCGVSTRPARLSLQTQSMAGAKAKGESAPGRESEPQSGSDPMRGNEPEAGGGSDADERNEGGKAKE